MDTIAINKARIVYYRFFASLLAFNLTEQDYKNGLEALGILSANPIDEQSEIAFTNLQRRFGKNGFQGLSLEANRVFCNPAASQMPTTASYYSHGRDDGPKRVEMINYVLQSGYRRNAASYKEHEDHIEFILLFLANLIREEVEGNPASGKLAVTVFTKILNPMLDQFTDDLFNHEKSRIYKQVALALRSFTEFERVYLNIDKPEIQVPNQKLPPHAAPAKKPEGGCVKMNTGLSA